MAPRANHPLLPRWLIHLGTLGLFAVAVLDSSVIPLPLPGSTDLLLLWLISHRGEPWLLTSSALAGSVIGGYTCWSVGRSGGEKALARYEKHRWLRAMSGWMKDHSVAAVLIPAALPPPIPLSPFLVAAGALGISRERFLIAFSFGRALRYGFVAWLAMRYGRSVIRMWNQTLSVWSAPLLWSFAGITIVGVAASIWRMRASE